MANKYEHINENLLIKYVLGEASDSESRDVEAWIKSSDENAEQYDQLEKVWRSIESRPLNVDIDQAWQKVSMRIAAEEFVQGEPVVRTLERPNFRWYAAAVILALVGMFTFFQYLFRNDEVQLASKDIKLEETLNDGSVVTLNAGSKLSYSKIFKGEQREVKLEGEAFFDVAKDPDKPFVINTERAEIKVLGTSFNVEAMVNSDVRVHVVSGSVQLSVPGSTADSLKVVLEPGTTGVIALSGRVYKEKPMINDALFWMDKRLEFDKTPLPEVFQVLERNYRVEFTTVDPDLKKCLLTARFREDSVKNILSVIEATFDVQFELGENEVRIKSDNQNCSEG